MRFLAAFFVVTMSVSSSAGAADKATPAEKAAAKAPAKKKAAAKPKATPKPTMLDLLKGDWTACRPAINEAGEALKTGGSLQDRYGQTGPLTYTQTIASASDKECKKITSETRTSFECDELTPDLLTCKTSKREERKAGGKWKTTPMLDHAGTPNHYTIKLSITAKDADTVELSITSDESEERESFELKRAGR